MTGFKGTSTAVEGAATPVFLAVTPRENLVPTGDVGGISCRFFVDCMPNLEFEAEWYGSRPA
jgi:hypothetical protein